MGGAWAILVIVLLLGAVVGTRHRMSRARHPLQWWRQRAQQRFYREMCRRWGDDPIPSWRHDERARSRAMRAARAHKTRS